MKRQRWEETGLDPQRLEVKKSRDSTAIRRGNGRDKARKHEEQQRNGRVMTGKPKFSQLYYP